MTNKIIERIERDLGVTGLVHLLADKLSPTDLQSLLLEVYRQRAEREQPSAVLANYESNRFVRPSTVSPLVLQEWDRICFDSLAADFRPIALSPVSPLGSCSAIALVDQNKVLSTIRNTEVNSDSTNVMALECAIQRRTLMRSNPKSKVPVHLAASQRLLRTQQYAANPDVVPHFSTFALCSAGQDQGSLRFELATLLLHIAFYARAIRAFAGEATGLQVAITDFGANDRRTLLTEHLLTPVLAQFANIECMIDDQREGGRDYYVDLCFHVYAKDAEGQWLELADGGVVNWTQRLLNNAKERCVISGIGSERVCTRFEHNVRVEHG